MSTKEISKDLEGNKKYQIKAREVLPILVRQAKSSQKITYADLAYEVSYSNPRNLNYPLGSIGTALIKLSKKWGEEIPQIQCIVVSKATGLPGEGIDGFISDEKTFSKLNDKQKNALVDGLLAKIYAYDKWDTVLNTFDLNTSSIPKKIREKIKKISSSSSKKGGGEGKEHKKLKVFISNNPKALGLKYVGLIPKIEKHLPSGDSIDVFFKNKKNWIGVEVKSIISNDSDILRGLYQCVKYQSVMEKHLSVLDIQKDTKVILALGGSFPDELIPVKNILGIEVIDNINSQ
jgi:hypothetical protein